MSEDIKSNSQETSLDQVDPEEETFSWEFYKWPCIISLVLVVGFYLFVFGFIDPNPPYFDPALLPPPPPGK
jgi:hypothetical protein